MSQRSKRAVSPRQCKVCGCVQYQFVGVKSYPCPYKALHRQVPAVESLVENALEHCELMIDESIADLRDGPPRSRRSYRGEVYDEGYAQGRKDACRVIRLCLGKS